MRIDASQILASGGIKLKAGAESVTRSLKEGDIIRAEVLSSEKGSVVMKTEGGQTFKAKLEAEVALMSGDKVLLEVTGKEKGLVLLSAGSEDDVLEATSRHMGRTREAADKSLEPYLGKLAELNMPVGEGAARLMRAIMALNPGMTPEEAAFLASNKLTGDESLMKAALALLANGEKTDVMIARLLALLGQEKPGEDGASWTALPAREDGLQVADPGPPQGTTGAQPGPHAPQPAAAQSLSHLLAAILNGSAEAGGGGGRGNLAPLQSLQTIIAQNDVVLQSTNVVNEQDFIKNNDNLLKQEALMSKFSQIQASLNQEPGVQNPVGDAEGRPAAAAVPVVPGATLPGMADVMTGDAATGGAVPGDAATGGVVPGGALPDGAPSASAGPQLPVQAPPGSVANAEPTPRGGGLEAPEHALTRPGAPDSNLHAQLSTLLAEIPEFRGTPPQALERFSGMLLRIAGEGAFDPGGEIEKLQAQLDKLFTRIGKGDTDAGARLKEAREELYARLALIEEAISRAAPAGRAEMHGQTQRLMEHVRLLNSIDQFAYMQLPVQFGEERKTADLYLFKRKGSRKPDPENVNILLALDLEHMGHWESLMNIRKKDVSIQMEVRGEREKEHFSENTVMLHEMLAEAGFKLVNTDIKHSEKETTPLTALLSLGRYTAGRTGTVDFWV